MKPISVIIVNFNAGTLLTDCVRSVLASSLPVEVIVSDNASTDDSLFELRRHFQGDGRLTILQNSENLGFAKGNNIALPLAGGEFILFLNPDCIVRPDTLREMLQVMESRPRTGMAGCLIRNLDGSEQAGCRRSIPTPWRTFIRLARLGRLAKYHPGFESYVQTGQPMPEEPISVEAISGAFMLVRRSAMDAVGPMDDGYFMHCEDLDWCMRFREAGLDILFVPHVEIMHVGGVCSASRPVSVEYYKHKGMVRFYRKFFRYKYPALLMWMVMGAIGIRFILRALSYLFATASTTKNREAIRTMYTFSPTPRADEEPGQTLPPGNQRRVIVTGATSLIGDYLLPALVQAGFQVHAISRNPPAASNPPGLHWHRLDISTAPCLKAWGAEFLIHLAPLATLPPLLENLADSPMKRLIAFGSTSLFTKCQSGYQKERLMVHGLQEAENKLADFCTRHGIEWTVFRPTLVYRLGRDKNVTTIAHFVRRFGFFPLVGDGNGLRQPVHAEDLANACLNALETPQSYGKSYNLSGGETLTYRDMVERISARVGRKSRIVNIPLMALRFCLRSLSLVPRYRHLNPEMANRINLDMCFDHDNASQDLYFTPRRFLETDTRSLKVRV